MKEDSKKNLLNQKSMNLTLISRRNRRLNIEDFSKRDLTKNMKLKMKLTKLTILNYKFMIHDDRLGRKHVI